jgi:Flp pilus assembly pilin Flp
MFAKIRRLKRLFKVLGRDTKGATAVEYVMILAGISAALVAAWTVLGANLNTLFTDAASGVSSAGSAIEQADSGESDDSSSDDDSESDSDDDSDSDSDDS